MFSEEHLYSIALRRTNLIGDINFQKLVEAVGSAKEVWEISKSGLKEITGIGSKISKEVGNSENLKFAVIGGGSWATAIAKMLCVNQKEIAWYMRNEDAIEHIKAHHHNPNYLSSVEFDIKKLNLTSDINQAVAYADYIIFAIPSAFLNGELEKLT